MSAIVPALHLRLLTRGDPGQLTGGYLYQQRLSAAAPAHAARIDTISLRPRNFAQEIAAARASLRMAAGYDALLLDSIAAAAAAPWLRSLRSRLPVIALVHQQPGGVDHGWGRSAVQTGLDLLAYRRANAVIAVSQWLADRLRARRIAAERLFVVPPGRDTIPSERVTPAPDLRRGRNAAAVCVSNWTPNKRVHLALDALAGLQSELVTLHLVGDTTVDAGYAGLVRARVDTLKDRVVAHGSLLPAQVTSLLASADFLVHPSRHESYGASVAEAMAAGLPIIAFRIDNLPHLVQDGIDGFLLRDGDVAAFAAAMAVLSAGASRRESMSKAARVRALEWPTWDQSAARFFEIVRQVVDG